MTTRFQSTSSVAARTVNSQEAAIPAPEPPRVRHLPRPRSEGGRPLLRAMTHRHSVPKYSDRPLSDQMLSDLLWAAVGVHRRADETTDAWMPCHDLTAYLATRDCLWRYDPDEHRLLLSRSQDVRDLSGAAELHATAAIVLIYVADEARMLEASAEERRLYAFTDTGLVGQSVNLFCASEGLATAFQRSRDWTELAEFLGLSPTQFVTLAQSVGYPVI